MSKILLISDNEKLCKNIEDALNKNAPSLVISIDENAIINYVEKSIVSLVIVDEAVKSLDALIICKKIQMYALKENVSIISLVDAKTQNAELLKVTAGAITKPVNTSILNA